MSADKPVWKVVNDIVGCGLAKVDGSLAVRLYKFDDDEAKVLDYLNALEASNHAAAARLGAWEAAMTDVSVINWTLSEDNAEDLHKQLVAVIAMTVQESLDPLVSEQAHKLVVAEQAVLYWKGIAGKIEEAESS